LFPGPDSTRAGTACYDPGMSNASRKTTTARLRRWRASLIRSRRLEYLGSVEAPDASAAELAAAEQFGLDDWQRKRLVLREVA
jgi:hypothetical protein